MADTTVDALKEELRRTVKELTEPKDSGSSGARMKAWELNGPADPTRRQQVLVPEGVLPEGAHVFVQHDALKGMTHITLEVNGGQYHTSVTDTVLATSRDIASIQKALIDDLLAQAGVSTEETQKYRDIKLSYWKWLIEETVSKHYIETGEEPRRIYLSQEVYEYIVQCEDDLPGRSRSGHKKVDHIVPTGLKSQWRTKVPAEGDFRRFIRVE